MFKKKWTLILIQAYYNCYLIIDRHPVHAFGPLPEPFDIAIKRLGKMPRIVILSVTY